MKKLALTLIAISGLLIVSSGAWAWQSNVNGSVNGNDRALAVPVGGAGNVIAAGYTMTTTPVVTSR